jgi:hypothetical protein
MLAARQALAVRRVGVAVTRLLVSFWVCSRASWRRRHVGSGRCHLYGLVPVMARGVADSALLRCTIKNKISQCKKCSFDQSDHCFRDEFFNFLSRNMLPKSLIVIV